MFVGMFERDADEHPDCPPLLREDLNVRLTVGGGGGGGRGGWKGRGMKHRERTG
jgi:hypothetical protein